MNGNGNKKAGHIKECVRLKKGRLNIAELSISCGTAQSQYFKHFRDFFSSSVTNVKNDYSVIQFSDCTVIGNLCVYIRKCEIIFLGRGEYCGSRCRERGG